MEKKRSPGEKILLKQKKVEDISEYIDCTLLKAEASENEVVLLCEEARKHCFPAVIINPFFVKRAVGTLKGSKIKTGTVIGFPMGSELTETKCFATRKALENGAREIDMVVNLGALKSTRWEIVREDIERVKNEMEEFLKKEKGVLKVIIEIGLLSEQEVMKVCALAGEIGIDYLKTSTGILTEGVTVEQVKRLRKILDGKVKIKASGGIKDLKKSLSLIRAGADRIGTSSAFQIVKEWKERSLDEAL